MIFTARTKNEPARYATLHSSTGEDGTMSAKREIPSECETKDSRRQGESEHKVRMNFMLTTRMSIAVSRS